MKLAPHYHRLLFLTVLLVCGLAALIGRFYLLQIRWHEDIAVEADKFSRSRRLIQPWRGEIRDRNSQPLAWSVPVVDVYANLGVCKDHVESVARVVGPLLGVEHRRLLKSMYEGLLPMDGGPKDAVLLKRNVTIPEWELLRNTITNSNFGMEVEQLSRRERAVLTSLRKHALFVRETQMREYLMDDSLQHVIGAVMCSPGRLMPEGLGGIELRFNELLSGKPGYCFSRKNARGEELPFQRYEQVAPVNGSSIDLTIDFNIQRIAEVALEDAMERTGAKSGAIVIMDPTTGEVLALACLPAFNLRNPKAAPIDWWRHHPVSTQYEPGSTFKLITLVAALDLGVVSLDHRVDCERGYWARVKLHDHRAFGVQTVRDAFGNSSDVGLAKIAFVVGPERLYNYVTNFGFDRATGIALPGEPAGYVPHWTNWAAHDNHLLARVAFGQGFRVTQLQMTVAYCAAVNGGQLMRPLLVRQIENANGEVVQTANPTIIRRVIRPETSVLAREALAIVTRPGYTGWRANLTCWTCGGKTSTAQKSTTNGYISGALYCGFIGHAPADKPKVVISVAFDEPRTGSPSGGAIAAPVFKDVAEAVLAYLGVPADKLPDSDRRGLQLAGSGAGRGNRPVRARQ